MLFRSRVIGVLMIAGLAWLSFLWPPFGAKYFSCILAADIGEGALGLWLLIVGVNVPKWQEKASTRQVGGA